jgi:endonuclease/exonuclease/phosphatase family metal-dependent hydrolase
LKESLKMPVFSLLSLNTFGIPFYLSLSRIKRLAQELNALAPSVICLQEIQQNALIPLLQRNFTGYSHFAFFRNSLAPKGGLFTVSTYPVLASRFFPFPNRGKWFSSGFADWALNKGVLLVELDIQGHHVIVMNTHLQANYPGNWRLDNSHAQIQLDQVKAITELAQNQPEDALVLVCGDFNFPRQTPIYEWMIAHSGLIDPLVNDPHPTYQPFPLVPSRWKTTLDYFFYRVPQDKDWKVSAQIIPIVNTRARHAIQRFLTDHQALLLHVG